MAEYTMPSEASQEDIATLNGNLASKVNTSDIANNLTTTASGKVLDARQGKALNDKIPTSVTFYGTAATGVTATNLSGRAYGKVCSLNIHVKRSSSASGWTTVATLPSEYKPAIQKFGLLADDDSFSGGSGSVGEVRVTTDGEIQIFSPSSHTYWGGITYVCK